MKRKDLCSNIGNAVTLPIEKNVVFDTIYINCEVSANVSDGTNTRSSSPSLKTYEKRQKNVMENCCLHYYKTLQTLMMNVSFRTTLFQDPDIKNGAYE